VGSPSRSGIFEGAASAEVEQFTESISYDHRLYRQDIQGSVAHARMLAHVGLISAEESRELVKTLGLIEKEIASGKFSFRTELEDIHMHVEQALIDRLGDVGRKLHTGRSRNDQVATDLRLWVRDAMDEIDRAIVELQRAFVGRCNTDEGVIVPAYTHLRRAQPVLVNHYWLAYCEKLQRDRERLQDSRKRVNCCSLGSAAVAGTSLPIDREFVAKELGFEQVMANSMDATSDRDFLLEFVAILNLAAIHLSSWAEEWILWSGSEYQFLELPHAYCTGSSIMPQKINPDVLELIRGRTSRAVGAMQSLLVLTKGLPLAYNRDLQEDKLPLFSAYDSVLSSLRLAVPLVRESTINRDRVYRSLDAGFLDATTLMEHMILEGIPQRTAHHVVGEIVRYASHKGSALKELTIDEFRQFHPQLDERVYKILGSELAIQAFRSVGSTAPREVQRQQSAWESRLAVQ
jgi:argininosuccinate lyase